MTHLVSHECCYLQRAVIQQYPNGIWEWMAQGEQMRVCVRVCVSKNATQIQCVNHAWPQEYGVRDVSLSLGLPFSFNQSQLMLKHMLYGRIRNDVMRQL